MFVPSPYQRSIFAAIDAFFGPQPPATRDILVEAVAGSGKTRTIQEASKRLPANVQRRCLMTAFNSHIKTELEERQKRGEIPDGIRISTIHGLGWGILNDYFKPRDKRNWLDNKKYERLTHIWYLSIPGVDPDSFNDEDVQEILDTIEKLVGFAQLTLTEIADYDSLLSLAGRFGISFDYEKIGTVLDGVKAVLKLGITGLEVRDRDGQNWHPSERISFTDMIWLPIALNLRVPEYELVFVDEAQDLSRCQQELILRARGKTGRGVWVGDRRQAIYGFAGADSLSFARIQETTGASTLPLSVCYRCDQNIVRYAQPFVPNLECSDLAGQGVVLESTPEDALLQIVSKKYSDREVTNRNPFLLLCRVNAPLISAAFRLIAEGVPAQVKGRDIGRSLVREIDKIAKIKDQGTYAYPFEKFPAQVEAYRAIQHRALEDKPGAGQIIANLDDRMDSILAVHSAAIERNATSVADLRSYIEELFTDKESPVLLSSIHKAKGLEADRVGVLRCDLMPHRMAKQDWEQEQEKNLAYIAITRAKSELYLTSPLRADAFGGLPGFDEAPSASIIAQIGALDPALIEATESFIKPGGIADELALF